jgi:hypothetical protein
MDIADCTPVKRSKIVFQSYERKQTLCEKISAIILAITPKGSLDINEEKSNQIEIKIVEKQKDRGIQCNIDPTEDSWGQYIHIDKKS